MPQAEGLRRYLRPGHDDIEPILANHSHHAYNYGHLAHRTSDRVREEPAAVALFAFFSSPLWPYLLAVIAAALLIGFMLVSAIFSVWLERKVAGRIQDRLGPTRVGGKFGWLQTLADGMKLLVKEDLIPAAADHMLFRLGPYIALAGSFMAFVALPFGNGVVAREMNIGLFYMLAIMSTEVFGIILIGYGSGRQMVTIRWHAQKRPRW